MTLDNVRETFRLVARKPRRRYGYLGRDDKVIADPDRPGFVFVRVQRAGGYELGSYQVKGGVNTNVFNLPVTLEQDERTGQWYVVGTDTAVLELAGVGNTYDLPTHGKTHGWQQADTIWNLHPMQLFPLRVQRKPELGPYWITVRPGTFLVDKTIVRFLGQDFDLDSYRPATVQYNYVVVGVDKTASIVVEKVNPTSANTIPYTVDAYPIALVKVPKQGGLLDEYIEDLRLLSLGDVELQADLEAHVADPAAHHDPVTLTAEADNVLELVDQQLDLDTQSAGTVLAGPVSGVDAKPSFRSLNASDYPDALLADGSRPGATAQAQDFGSNGVRLARGISGAGAEGGKVRWGTPNGPYIASVQIGADIDQQGLIIYVHPSGAYADPPKAVLKLTGYLVSVLGANLDVDGYADANVFRVNGIQVVGSRVTGWGTPTGTATRTGFDTATVTLEELAERVAALILDLRAHGLIGS